MPPSPLSRLRKLCLALPEAHEVEAWGEPTFRVRNKIFAMYAHANNHHGGGPPRGLVQGETGESTSDDRCGARSFLLSSIRWAERLGRRLAGGRLRLERAEDLLRDGYRMTAPKKLLALVKDDWRSAMRSP